MHTVTKRVYDTDSEGRRFLLYRPGDVIDDKEAQRVASLVAPAVEAPAKPLGDMKLAELRTICDAEGIDPGDASLRGDYIKVIGAARGQRQSEHTDER